MSTEAEFLKGKLGNFTAQQDIVKSSLYKFQIEPLVTRGEWGEKCCFLLKCATVNTFKSLLLAKPFLLF